LCHFGGNGPGGKQYNYHSGGGHSGNRRIGICLFSILSVIEERVGIGANGARFEIGNLISRYIDDDLQHSFDILIWGRSSFAQNVAHDFVFLLRLYIFVSFYVGDKQERVHFCLAFLFSF